LGKNKGGEERGESTFGGAPFNNQKGRPRAWWGRRHRKGRKKKPNSMCFKELTQGEFFKGVGETKSSRNMKKNGARGENVSVLQKNRAQTRGKHKLMGK